MATSVTPIVCATLALGLGRGRSSCCAEAAAASWSASRAAAGTAARAMCFLMVRLLFFSRSISPPVAGVDRGGRGFECRGALRGETGRGARPLLAPDSRRLDPSLEVAEGHVRDGPHVVGPVV